MISICIPVYNFDVRKLVKDLHDQALQAGVEFEILLFDDRSTMGFRRKNQELQHLPGVKLTQLKHNHGRSRIRNLLADHAQYPWIIFMDCDSACPDEKFLERYLSYCGQTAVVCGGISYLNDPVKKEYKLHWLSGTQKEVKPWHVRRRNPWNSFMTGNFMVPADILKKIRFNENIQGYGHEDTLFGLELKKQKIRVIHIDNPLIHLGLQKNEEYLLKTQLAASNLLKILAMTSHKKDFIRMVRLLKVWRVLKITGLHYPIARIFTLSKPFILKNLKGNNPSLLMLDFFKLGSICVDDHRNLKQVSSNAKAGLKKGEVTFKSS
jgi:glycosyltransferase involved in cell wall biosynthesis